MLEQWRPVPGYAGLYEVSDLGRVKSLARLVDRPTGQSLRPERILNSTRQSSGGYIRVTLSNKSGSRSRTVHSIVAEAFHGARPDGQVARHLDGNPANNAATNIAWGTYGENELDKVRHGTHQATRKTVCKRGHALAGANLRRSAARKGHRACEACHRAKDRARYRPELDLQSLSDAIFASIVEGGVLAEGGA